METNFLSIRKKTRIAALICALLIGIGVGVISSAVLLTVLKLCAVSSVWWYYVCCGAFGLLVFFGAYICFMPSDRRLAKRLDEEHGLDEKMRTMIAFSGSDDEFVRLQRSDADDKLGRVKYKPWRKKQLISALVVFAVSAVMLVGGLFVPASAKEKPIDEDQKKWILDEIQSMIDTVEYSKEREMIDLQLANTTVYELRSLALFVDQHELMSEMKAEAILTIVDINNEYKNINTAIAVGKILSESYNETLADIGKDLKDVQMKNLGTFGADDVDSLPGDEISAFADEFSNAVNSVNQNSKFIISIRNSLSIMKGYADNISAGDLSDSQINSLRKEFRVNFNLAWLEAVNALSVQWMNKEVITASGTGIIPRLCALFGILQSEIDAVAGDGEIEVDDTDGDKPGNAGDYTAPDNNQQLAPNGGGGGTGEMERADSKLVYDVNGDESVPYGEIINTLSSVAIQKADSGKWCDEEFAAMLQEYFDSLKKPVTESGSDAETSEE